MIGEIDLYGVFIPSLLLWVGLALPLTAGLRRLLRFFGFITWSGTGRCSTWRCWSWYWAALWPWRRAG
jgi:hypothetical protein